MKTIFLLLWTSFILAMPITQTIEELIEVEKKEDLNIPNYDPFKRTQPLLNQKTKKRTIRSSKKLELSAIFNKKAFISGKWYEKGDISALGKIMKVHTDKVYIKQGNKTKVLRLKRKKSKFILGEKGKK